MVATPPPTPPSPLGRMMLAAAGMLLVAVLARPVGELVYLLATAPGQYISDSGMPAASATCRDGWRTSGGKGSKAWPGHTADRRKHNAHATATERATS